MIDRRRRLILASAALGVAVCSAPAAGQTPRAQNPCSAEVRVMEKSFQQLPAPARNTYVWADDINSRIFGGYNPFPVYVLVGGAYSPFQASSGKLDRTSFEQVAQATYGAKRYGPMAVSPASVQNGSAVVTFTSGTLKISMKVLSVTSRFVSGDSMQVKLCW